MNQKRKIGILPMCICAAALALHAAPAAAEEEAAPMTFRMAADETYVSAEELAEGDVLLHGGLYIDNYTGLTQIMMTLKSDAPLHIENGGFTKEPAFFTDAETAMYTAHSDTTGAENSLLWYSRNWVAGQPAEVLTPGGSFLQFDIRVPQETSAGMYQCYISTDVQYSDSGMMYPDLELTNGSEDLTDSVVLLPCTVTVEPAVLRGDVDCDGSISSADAQAALEYFVTKQAELPLDDEALAKLLGTPYIHAGLKAADVIEDGEIATADAQCILEYFVNETAGNHPDWDTITGGGRSE